MTTGFVRREQARLAKESTVSKKVYGRRIQASRHQHDRCPDHEVCLQPPSTATASGSGFRPLTRLRQPKLALPVFLVLSRAAGYEPSRLRLCRAGLFHSSRRFNDVSWTNSPVCHNRALHALWSAPRWELRGVIPSPACTTAVRHHTRTTWTGSVGR